MAPIASRMQCGGRFRQMFANDARITDLLVAERELVMRKADGARIVRQLGMFQGARVERDGARLFAACVRDPAMQPPQRREERIADRFAERVGRAAERRRGLGEVVLKEPCFGERRTQGDFVLARQGARTQHGREELDRVGAAPAFECRLCPP